MGNRADLYHLRQTLVAHMIGETLEITIVVSMIVLIAYPSIIALRQVVQERRGRRVHVPAVRNSAKEGRLSPGSGKIRKSI